MGETILIVDDDPVQRRILEAMVRKFGAEPRVVEGGEAALAALDGPQGDDIACIVLDLVMPDLDGLGVLGKLRERGSALPVVVQTAQGSIDTVVSAMRAGAVDFVVKPVGFERLSVSLRNALAGRTLETEVKRLKRRHEGTIGLDDLVSASIRMQPALRLARKAATSDIPVLIEGESGVGKEVVARAIAGSGARRGRPFVAVNCGALPENLVESILFGHEKGAFTGATEKHAGKFVEAHGGTLFLDEVGELPAAAQVKLLRAIQEREVDPVGAKRSVKVDVRLISATNRDLVAEVKAGRFREDLFYRLHVFPLRLPPLRERREDVPELVRRFVARFALEEGRRIRSVTPAALRLLESQPWPGNVRQLENAVFRAVVLAETDELGPDEFPQLTRLAVTDAAPPLAPEPEPAAPLAGAGLMLEEADFAPRIAPAPDDHTRLALVDAAGELRPIETLEAEAIRHAIRHCRGQMTDVARKLGIGRSTLYRKLKELGLEDGGEASAAALPHDHTPA